MLFNHLWFSDISVEERNALLADDFFLKMIDHRNFNPRLIDLLTSADYVSIAGLPIRKEVERVLENPQELWEKPYRSHISAEGRALMLALFFNSARPPVPVLERAFARMSRAMGLAFPNSDLPVKFRSALKELEGSVLAIQERQVRFSNPGVRDFLQRAVTEDRFLPAAIEAIVEFDEVEEAWKFFSGQFPGLNQGDPAAPAWTGAVARLLEHGSGTTLQRLYLVIDMYNELAAKSLLPIVSSVIRELEQSDIDGTEADRCSTVLEHVVGSLLPLDILDDVQRVVSTAIANMLTEYGGSLSLDEIRSVAGTLLESGATRVVQARQSESL